MTTPSPQRIVQVFARPPVPGRTKTRLIPALGAAGAAELAAQLLQGTLQTVSRLDASAHELWLSEASPDGRPEADAAALGFSVHHQHGEDLGERMANAMATALTRAGRAVLIGSDCPQLDRSYLADAFAALDRDPVVIGPAVDGGYVLIGLAEISPGLLHDIFRDIPWGSGTVLARTRERLHGAGCSWHELTALRDIDDGDDLALFPNLQPRGSEQPSRPGAKSANDRHGRRR